MTRHAAVLGLGALVQAFPYTSPPPVWIPGVLATLANKANADPGMVGKSVKSILSEFKKTRQDTWHVDLKVRCFSSPCSIVRLGDIQGANLLIGSVMHRHFHRSRRRIWMVCFGRAILLKGGRSTVAF